MLSMSAFNKKPIKDDTRFIVWLIVGFIVVVWLCSPPGNKFLQMCFWGNNVKYFWAKVVKDPNVREYLHYRDNAIYLIKMFPKKPDIPIALMEKAIAAAPTYVSEDEYLKLYKDMAEIKLYSGDKQGAFKDFVRADKVLNYLDLVKVAMLATDAGKYKVALDYCNRIVNMDYTSYLGYACMAEVYDAYGRTDIAVKAFDIALDRKISPKAYAGRARMKQRIGDMAGYEKDAAEARRLGGSRMNIDYSLLDDTIKPKELSLELTK